jgi:hypothetical protein
MIVLTSHFLVLTERAGIESRDFDLTVKNSLPELLPHRS